VTPFFFYTHFLSMGILSPSSTQAFFILFSSPTSLYSYRCSLKTCFSTNVCHDLVVVKNPFAFFVNLTIKRYGAKKGK
jgi:hypothetical protein